MPIRPSIAVLAGAICTACIAVAASNYSASSISDGLAAKADAVLGQSENAQVSAAFVTPGGWPTRHPTLSGGENLDEKERARIATSIAGIPGVGGIRWSDGSMLAASAAVPITPMHCQKDVEALLRARTIRFEESSSSMDSASRELLDEVETALRPCLGSIIAITGHTDKSGPEPGNLALSRERANAVRNALIRRGIPRDGLRAVGVGSQKPVEGLDPSDPANRRIEFSVLATEPLLPTPVDTPGPR